MAAGNLLRSVFCVLVALGLTTGGERAIAASAVDSLIASSKPAPIPVPSVVAVAIDGETPNPKETAFAGLGDHIVVQVENLDEIQSQMRTQKTEKGFVLYLNGLAVKGLPPEAVGNPAGCLRFHIQKTEASRETWVALLGKPRSLTKTLTVNVGLEGEAVPSSKGATMNLVILRQGRLYISASIIMLVVFVLLGLAWSTSLLRDGDSLEVPADHPQPFSLARSQLAFWFVLVLSSYVFLWLVTGSADTLTASVLGLIGISASATAGAAVVDAGKQENAQNKLSEVNSRLMNLAAKATELAAKIAANPASAELKAELQTVEDEQTRLSGLARTFQRPASGGAKAGRNFLYDWISDANGVSLHRFQLVVWTLVIGVIFVYAVDETLAMPDFSATILGLMGISSATYVGMKVPEGKRP